MATLEKRVQVLFEPGDYALIEGEARAHGVSVGAFIREAVNQRVSAARADALASWQELWDLADADSATDTDTDTDGLDWEQLKSDHENEMDPLWRLSHNAAGRPRNDT